MDFSLDDEQALIVSTVRKMAHKELAEWSGDADRAGAPPNRLLDMAGEVGFLIDAVPTDRDGLLDGEYSHLTRALRGIELARGCPALAALLESNVEPALAVERWGSDAAKDALFGSITNGGLATTARDFGRALSLEADGDALVIRGELGPVPALAGASHLLLAARAGDEPVLVLLATELAQVTATTPSGWRAAQWGTLSCDGARVNADHVLARGSRGAGAIAQVLSWYRSSLAARAVGVCQIAMEHAAGYARDRVQFGQPIGQFESLVRMRDANETTTMAARALVLEAAWKLDGGDADAADSVSRARDFACQAIARTTIDAVQIYGGYGFVNEYPVEKLMRDARPFEVLCGNESLDRVLTLKEAA